MCYTNGINLPALKKTRNISVENKFTLWQIWQLWQCEHCFGEFLNTLSIFHCSLSIVHHFVHCQLFIIYCPLSTFVHFIASQCPSQVWSAQKFGHKVDMQSSGNCTSAKQRKLLQTELRQNLNSICYYNLAALSYFDLKRIFSCF